MTRLRLHVATLIAAIPMTALLAACSSSDSGGTAAGGGSKDSGSGVVGAAPAEAPAAGGEAAKDSASTATRNGGSARQAALQLDRAVISTGTVSLVAGDVASARREVQRIVDGARGQVSEEDTESDEEGEALYARLVLRVPSRDFDQAMTALEGVAKLRSSQRTAEDVTTQVIDTDARLRAQEASLERVEALLSRADRLQQVVWIESQLTQRQAELESLQQQQTWLADQTSLSTITVDIERAPDKAEKEEHEEAGFLAGLDGGLTALGATATALATVAGALLPFAVLLAVLGTPAWLVLRGVRRRRPPARA